MARFVEGLVLTGEPALTGGADVPDSAARRFNAELFTVAGIIGGKVKSSGNPDESSQAEKVAISNPVSPICDFRTIASSCGPTRMISVAVLPSFGAIADIQRFDVEFVDGICRPVAMLAS